jgi:glyoxylase-like metal-dependent hydrolase (beta-lactamase superfamily II)
MRHKKGQEVTMSPLNRTAAPAAAAAAAATTTTTNTDRAAVPPAHGRTRALAGKVPRALPALALLAASATACTGTSHEMRPAALGTASSSEAMEAVMDRPGPIRVETITAADWAVTRAGLINLDHPTAKAAGLKDGDEPISIFVHVLHHPTRGTFLVDSGVSRLVATDPAAAGIGVLVRHYLGADKLRLRTDTATLAARAEAPIAGVFLTHVHLDHVMGVRDLPAGTPLYTGPGEDGRAFMNMFTRGSINALLAGHDAIATWRFAADPSGRFAGVVDVFGDGSLFAISVPGHTAGSTAYLARTPDGPVLMTGDASHTRWGWDHDVEPGSFSADRPRSAGSLHALRALVARHPSTSVRLGHQP